MKQEWKALLQKLESFTTSQTDRHLLHQKPHQSHENKNWRFCCLQDKM